MRELTKSLFSFSWALSLFGIQQTANLLSPEKASKAFDCVTQATEGQMNDSLKSTFQAGDRMQRSAWNFMLGFFSRDAINPTRMMRMTADAARESASAMSEGMQALTSTMRQATSAAMSQNPGMSAPSGASSVEDPQDWASGINNCDA